MFKILDCQKYKKIVGLITK